MTRCKTFDSRGVFDIVCREMDDFVNALQNVEGPSHQKMSLRPCTNVAETDTDFEIVMDVPGMNGDDFDIELHEGRLTVSGERVKGEHVEGKTYHRVERTYGKFSRSFKLGIDIRAGDISADYSNGVLTVVVPKTERVQPKKIKVSVTE